MALSELVVSIWIGLSDKRSEGRWYWVNGERTVRSAVLWAQGQPDNTRNNEDCGAIRTRNRQGFGTNDDRCSKSHLALCEKQYND